MNTQTKSGVAFRQRRLPHTGISRLLTARLAKRCSHFFQIKHKLLCVLSERMGYRIQLANSDVTINGGAAQMILFHHLSKCYGCNVAHVPSFCVPLASLIGISACSGKRDRVLIFFAEQLFNRDAKHSRQLLQCDRSWLVPGVLDIRDGLCLHTHQLSELALRHFLGYSYFLDIIFHRWLSPYRAYCLSLAYSKLGVKSTRHQ